MKNSDKKSRVFPFRFAVTVVAVFICLLALAGCAYGAKADRPKELKIVASAFPQYDFARQITKGTDTSLTLLLKPGSEAHSYEPSPNDIIEIQNCDLFICVGGESEAWVNKIINSLESPPEILSLMETVEKLTEETVDGMETEEAHSHKDSEDKHSDDNNGGEYDEHVWTSPENAIKISSAICEKLCISKPENAQLYRANTKEYTEKLSALSDRFKSTVEGAKRKTIVFGDRFPFRYLANEYGIDYYAAFPGCSSQTEASAATIVFLIEKIKQSKIPIVFTVEFSNEKIANTISKETGAKNLSLHSCHTISAKDMKDGVTYLDLMERNLANITEALN